MAHEPFLTVRSFAFGFPRDHMVENHRHDWHQLLYACTGAMTVSAGRSSWIIPPGKSVFIPAGCSHSIRMWGEVAMRSLYFPTSLTAEALAASECRVLSVTALLRELILRTVELSALDSRIASHENILKLLLDEMHVAAVTPLIIALPADPRATAVARHVLASPSGAETLDELAHRYGAGRRTLERLFHRETGMSFGLWRQKVRLLNSIRILAEDRSVTDAALEAGYASVSAFIAAFKETFGCTPGRF